MTKETQPTFLGRLRHYSKRYDPGRSQWLGSFQTHWLSVSPVSERSLPAPAEPIAS
ncbi:MAG: hypothetical protein F6K18_03240 [Okeania sp. SIO2C2]|uniref:hypothetical protein n=1 Tax=Okeania sp. SIO2C2 TaxID=2607787 RepID=UPI0013B90D52|nr:hypothetical protein [Okeania sp. SIO2C2]NEP85910.1 hypothetical protein [Okeania sp. SIO2C2]